jgi:thiosulfate reductase cytochrome b subunit
MRADSLQRLTCLGLKLLIFPIQGLTGLAYYYYDELSARSYLPDGVGTIALIHTAGAFALVAFLIAHLYLTTTGETLTSNPEAMVTGWEELPAPATARQSPETSANTLDVVAT